ncbi:MAG: hypothetical protein HDR30_00760 [Lachnospiraceae bacterium]|nr:hypothetical protein [Lachnospiraceae bacterium]
MKKILTWICIINLLWITGCSGKDAVMEEESDTSVNDLAASEASFTQDAEEAVVDNAESKIADSKESEVETLDTEEQEAEPETLDTEEPEGMSEEVIEQLQYWLNTYRPPLPGADAEILQLQGYSNLELRMEDSCYPALRESLQQYSEQAKNYAEDSSYQVIVHRADVRALSFLEIREEGAVCRGYHFDPETGRTLALEDIVHDVDRLSLIIESQLRINYPDVDFADDMAKRLKQIWQDEEATWTISYHGICFYIPSETLASKKGILLHAAVLFQDVPDLFAEKYMQIPEAYTIELEDDIPLLYDIDMDGSIDRIQVFHYLQAEPKDTEIQINDKKCAGYYDGMYNDQSIRWTYLLHTAGNRNYIVFWTVGELDGSGCYGVYAVENGEIEYRGCEEKNIYLGENRITDPACVRVDNPGDPIFSGFFWNEIDYYIDESGFWQTDNKIYYYHDTGREIKALVELKMPLVDPYTGEMAGAEITLPEGTYMEPLRTDLHTWSDFVLEDGSVCRMEFDEPYPNSDWDKVEYNGKDVLGECISAYPSQTKLNRKAGQ